VLTKPTAAVTFSMLIFSMNWNSFRLRVKYGDAAKRHRHHRSAIRPTGRLRVLAGRAASIHVEMPLRLRSDALRGGLGPPERSRDELRLLSARRLQAEVHHPRAF